MKSGVWFTHLHPRCHTTLQLHGHLKTPMSGNSTFHRRALLPHMWPSLPTLVLYMLRTCDRQLPQTKFKLHSCREVARGPALPHLATNPYEAHT